MPTWIGESDASAGELVAGKLSKKTSKRLMASSLALSLLDGGMKPNTFIIKEEEKIGISKMTIASAKAELPIRYVKKSDGWYWKKKK